jgi:hypothetical protein
MSNRLQLLLRIFSIEFAAGEREWWHDKSNLQSVFSALDEMGFWADFELFGVEGNPGSLTKIEPTSNLLAKSTSWKPKSYVLQRRNDEELSFGFALDPGELSLTLQADLSMLGQGRDRVLDRFVGFAKSIDAAFSGKALIGPDYEILLPALPYPRPRPPHMSAYGSAIGIVNLYSKAYFDKNDQDRANWEILSTAPLPPGATREVSGELLIVRWVKTLEDENSLARQRSAAEIWQSQNLRTRIVPGYNELGDLRVETFGLRPHPPLTLYESVSATGFKALVRNPDGSFDRESVQEAASWIRNRMLPDGTPLSRLRFILPNRDSAVDLHDEAEFMGADALLYIDNQKRLWNPFPPGLWINK